MHVYVNLWTIVLPLRVALLVAHVEDVFGVVAGDGGEGESGEDDGDDAGGDEARLEGVPARIINSIKYILQIFIIINYITWRARNCPA